MGKLNVIVLWLTMVAVYALRTFINTPIDWIILTILLTGCAWILGDDKLEGLKKLIKWVYLRD